MIRSVAPRACSLHAWARSVLPRQARVRLQSTSSTPPPPPPPLLVRLREDMKAAMRARDKPRLNVVKGIIGDMNNSPTPLRDDLAIVSLIGKKMKALDQAAAEYVAAGRQDLSDQAAADRAILAEYQGMVRLMGAEEVEGHVRAAIEEVGGAAGAAGAPQIGPVMKVLFGPQGALKDKPVKKQDVAEAFARIVKAG
ncbi:hypothetical protein KEM52_006399 [Ascosphaera acerosa]|nr:hypothetical protein KEM52_006399 [Ascosphaera acerosa]